MRHAQPFCVMFGTKPSPPGLRPAGEALARDDAAEKCCAANDIRRSGRAVDEIGAAIPGRVLGGSPSNGLPSRNRNFQQPSVRRMLKGNGTSCGLDLSCTAGKVLRYANRSRRSPVPIR